MAPQSKTLENILHEATKHEQWVSSTRFKLIGAEAIGRFNGKRHAYPKCEVVGVVTKVPCGNVALGNGKCWAHGGGPSSDERMLGNKILRAKFIEREKQRTLKRWATTPHPAEDAAWALWRVENAIKSERARRHSLFGRKQRVQHRKRLAMLQGRREALKTWVSGVFA